jgi:mono/diheme cytochrome c family protein
MGAVLALLATAAAQADGDRDMPARVPPAYTQECAACHTAYPPAMLPAASWRRVMEGLDKHYGTDATLDAATAREIGSWLQAHAGRQDREGSRLRRGDDDHSGRHGLDDSRSGTRPREDRGGDHGDDSRRDASAGAEPPQDRITRSAWFERKHRKIDAAVWQSNAVRSAANCAACHGGADRGRFDDDELRLPEGLTPRQRRAWHD